MIREENGENMIGKCMMKNHSFGRHGLVIMREGGRAPHIPGSIPIAAVVNLAQWPITIQIKPPQRSIQVFQIVMMVRLGMIALNHRRRMRRKIGPVDSHTHHIEMRAMTRGTSRRRELSSSCEGRRWNTVN
ncbi:hypothetical protein AN958_00098 [Leucoagaricus sp. SymC.cos]|nr:hypothetical protein AN958_00098 [Leucoagaricus sp. SymC.cos]